jgi:hypothetical protein
MKTMTIDHVTANLAVRHGGSSGAVPPASLVEAAAITGAAIERQLDEIQRTFGVRWEW